jgi:hypothetical protein
MKRRRKLISVSEQQRRAEQREQSLAAKESGRIFAPDTISAGLLYDRQQTAHLLNVSRASLRRMELRGLLTPLRPSGAEQGKVQYGGGELLAIRIGVDAQAR